MRSSKSRSRNKSRNRPNNANNQNRVFDSSGPEGKVRGTPQQIVDKYNQLARDATLGNDRVAAENFQQHAEHYKRLLTLAMREAEARREQHESQQRDRQVQRDTERVQRDENRKEQETGKPESQGTNALPDMAMMEQPDTSGTGLVDTPESKPAPRKRTTKPKANPLDNPPDAPKAAE